jgi:hypothetical protein
MFDLSSQLYVLALEGWQDSIGVAMELEWDKAAGRALTIIYPENYGL